MTPRDLTDELAEALRAAMDWMYDDGCDCGTDEPGTCALCVAESTLARYEARSRGESEWQLISTAPQDRWHTVLGWCPRWPDAVVVHRGGAGQWYDADGRVVKITHWMPLPEPPETDR